MVYAESGPRDGGMTLFCKAMLGTEAGIPLLSVKTPLLLLPFSSSSSFSTSAFEFLFPDPFGVRSLQTHTARTSPVHQLLVHLCLANHHREISMKTKHPLMSLWYSKRVATTCIYVQLHWKQWESGQILILSQSCPFKMLPPPLLNISPLWAALLYFQHNIAVSL